MFGCNILVMDIYNLYRYYFLLAVMGVTHKLLCTKDMTALYSTVPVLLIRH